MREPNTHWALMLTATLGVCACAVLVSCGDPAPPTADAVPATPGSQDPATAEPIAHPPRDPLFDVDEAAKQIVAGSIRQLETYGVNHQTVTDALVKVHERYPHDERVAMTLTRVFHSANDYESAASVFESSIDWESDDETRHHMATLYAGAARQQDAVDALRPLVEKYPDNAQYTIELAVQHFYLDQFDEAAATLDAKWDAVVAFDSEKVHWVAGASAIELGDYARAEKLLREGIARHPDSYQAHYYLGRLLAMTDRLDEAAQVTLKVDALRERRQKSGRYMLIARTFAHAWLDRDFDTCMNSIDQLLADTPPDDLQARAMLTHVQGRVLITRGEQAAGEAKVNEAAAMVEQLRRQSTPPVRTERAGFIYQFMKYLLT